MEVFIVHLNPCSTTVSFPCVTDHGIRASLTGPMLRRHN